jgi:hypothetical protein
MVPDGKKYILIKYFITRTTKDSILNKSYTVPTWTIGFKRIFELSKARSQREFVTDKGLFRQNAVDKKAIVLNKLNFQNESSISSEMNFNSFDISTTKGAEPRFHERVLQFY